MRLCRSVKLVQENYKHNDILHFPTKTSSLFLDQLSVIPKLKLNTRQTQSISSVH